MKIPLKIKKIHIKGVKIQGKRRKETQIMKNVLFKDNFVDINEEYLDELKGEFRETLGIYKTRLKDVENLTNDFTNKTTMRQVINLIISMLAKRSTVGTEELEGYKPDINKLENNLKENTLSMTDESMVALDILSMYLKYELPDGILTNDEITNIHSLLFKSNKKTYKAGKYRKTGDNNVMNSFAKKIYVDSKFVNKNMNNFVIYYNSMDNLSPITKAAMIHGILTGIHPFKDGNGRVTRLITDKYISKTLGVPLFISESINLISDNNEYGMVLDQFHLENNSLPLIRFFYNVVINQLKINTLLVEEWLRKVKDTSFFLSKKGIKDKYINDLSIYLTDKRYIHQKELADALNVTPITASTLIDDLKNAKIIVDSKQQGRIILHRIKIEV